MQIEDWASCPNQAKLYRELAQLDLLEHIAELDVFGFTVVPAEKVAPPEFHARVKEALIDVMEGRFGPLSDDGMSWKDRNQIFRMILWERRVFEELLLNPAGLGLVQYLVGTNCILSLFDGWVKGPGEGRTALHRDNWDYTRPASAPEPNSANFNYLVTDYSAEDGAFAFGKQDFDLGRAQEASAVVSGVLDAAPYLSLFDREPAGDRVSARPDYDYHAFDLDAYRQKQERMLALAREMAGQTENGGGE